MTDVKTPSPATETIEEDVAVEQRPAELRTGLDQRLLYDLQMDGVEFTTRHDTDFSLDVVFLMYLRRMARFGFFNFGPVTIDVRLIEDIVERNAPRCETAACRADGGVHHVYSDDFVRFSRTLVEEVRRSGRKRIDELHFLLAFMRTSEGLPVRVFGELGVKPEEVEAVAMKGQAPGPAGLEKLYSPEEAAEYLGVHVQTVRAWIRSGRLPASRLTGQRALRVKASDLLSVLEPVDTAEIG